jgi:hypothetical protein
MQSQINLNKRSHLCPSGNPGQRRTLTLLEEGDLSFLNPSTVMNNDS